jgi:hypothetical protein
MAMTASKIAGWIIRTDQPFRGNAQSILLTDGTVAYTPGRQTFEQYKAENGDHFEAIDNAAFDALLATFEASRRTEPKSISEERYWEMLECLPPSKYCEVAGVTMFHICERITGELVDWFAVCNGKHFTLCDYSHADRAIIAARIRKAEGL